MKVDFEKVGIIAAYLADNTNTLYVTKLLKLFYYIDFITFNQKGASVTNDWYFKLPYGPVPTTIKNEIDILASNTMESGIKSQLSKYIKLEDDQEKNGKLVVSRTKNYNLRTLSNYEIEIVKAVAGKFKNTRAKQLSNQTHKEKPWLLTNENSVIDYALSRELDVKKIIPNL
jgi:uncharacterized phage-associated protein